MTRQDIRSSGVVSVIANIVPGPIGENGESHSLLETWRKRIDGKKALDPLFKLVIGQHDRILRRFEVPVQISETPVPIKTIMKGWVTFRPCRLHWEE